MKKDDLELTDELRPEYDLKSLKVRRLGPGRKRFGNYTEPERSQAQTLATHWNLTELWVDRSASPPYVLMLLANESGNCCIYDPKQDYEAIYSSSNYQEAKLWLLEDEYERVEGQLKMEEVA